MYTTSDMNGHIRIQYNSLFKWISNWRNYQPNTTTRPFCRWLADMRDPYMWRTANICWRMCVVVKQIQSNNMDDGWHGFESSQTLTCQFVSLLRVVAEARTGHLFTPAPPGMGTSREACKPDGCVPSVNTDCYMCPCPYNDPPDTCAPGVFLPVALPRTTPRNPA